MLISMAGLIFVETSLKAKAHVIRLMICFALTRLECMFKQVLKQICLHPSGLLTAYKRTLKVDR